MKRMRNIFISLMLVLMLLTGCGNQTGNTMKSRQYTSPVKVQSNGKSAADLTEGRHIVSIHQLQNTAYVSLDDLTQATGYHGAWLHDGTYGVGDYDAVWVFRTGQASVSVAGKKVQMPAAAIKEGDKLFMPVSGLKKLFGDVTVFTVETDDVAFFPKPSPNETGVAGQHLDFSDAKPTKPAMARLAAGGEADTAQEQSVLTFAKKFLGIKYVFGTGTYEQTKSFDCSSFTQYVFNQFGIELPRVARQQAEKGKYVERDKLQIGDLLFFYVPGRFKSNEAVGHVGIYIGDGNMIHASPKPKDGVQVTPINKTYWKDTFLYAKRFL
ncbi:C40 family peptidase [Cohnella sp. WQ 127256]|uniref:C40 family peptidase n=1 Tax=Cohnella sp. WQ 127256 TaxID=2938790 RepID=UPI002118F697|nr:C40 family peptidase [Cohnella sp. WQ 127256]